MKVKLIGRPQTLGPFCVGAILDIDGESFVAADIRGWGNYGEEIHEQRLEELLCVNRFKMAPAAPERPKNAADMAPGLPYYRFPEWLFCSSCRRMIHWLPQRERGQEPTCAYCPRKLIPMRFVMACPQGHLADVPWKWWAHSSKENGKCEVWDLEFNTYPGGSGLEFVSVRCRACKAERSLEGLASPNSLKDLKIHCPGRQPWQSKDEAIRCDAVPQVLQRGATNLTFAIAVAAIDIPPYSNRSTFACDASKIKSMPEFEKILKIIKTAPSSPIVPILIKIIASKVGTTPDEVRSVVDAELQGRKFELVDANVKPYSELDLLIHEFKAFIAPDVEGSQDDPRDRFRKRHVSLRQYLANITEGLYRQAVTWLTDQIDSLVQVTRLREVRVLKGFSRLTPVSGDVEDEAESGRFSVYDSSKKIMPSLVPADLGKLDPSDKWLPALEVFGEGIFLSLSEPTLQKWETSSAVRAHVQPLGKRHAKSGQFLPTPTPRLLLLHTLAHVLIRQLSFECGYSLASLRERIYASESGTSSSMAGILIYTAAGDAEGTLGGLVREGEPNRLLSMMVQALQSAEWCSSDPLCRESKGQGMNAMNLAACHACVLLPETCCNTSNRLLDRTMLLGSIEDPGLGFFSPLREYLWQNPNRE